MVHKAAAAIAQAARGIATAVRARWKIVLGATAAVSVFNLAAPVALLSLARRPPDYYTFNPWLSRLPEYLRGSEPLAKKLDFLCHMALGWVSASNAGEVDWGVIIDVPTLAQIVVTSLVFGTYFALWSYRRTACGLDSRAARPAGIAGAVTTVFGLTTGPCSLAGCGVPVLPVVGLALTGLSSGTLTLLTALSRISLAVVLSGMTVAVAWLGWRVGGLVRPPLYEGVGSVLGSQPP